MYKRHGYEWIAANVPKLSDELVTFKLVAFQEVSQIDYNNMEFFKALEAATNVHIDFECFPASSYNDQKNIMLSTNDYPDGFFGYNTLSMDDLNLYGPMGVFIPVDDLIDQYCPNYKDVLTRFPNLDGMSTSLADGKKYSWGTVNESPARDYPDNLYINKTWLDNLNLEVPTTMEEYYEVLKAFKEQDANGNGDPNDEIPYTFLAINQINGYGSFFGAYGHAEAFNAAGSTLNHFVVEDGKVIYEPITEEWKTAVKELGKFVQEGLWDQEGFVQDGDQYSAKLTSATPIVGSAYTWASGSFGDNGDQYIAIAPLKATADSQEPKVHKRQNHVSFLGTGFSITNKCENPEILAQWVDLFYNETMTILSYRGPERVKNIDENGVFTYDETPGADGASFDTITQHEAPFDGTPKCMTNDMFVNKIITETMKNDKIDVINEFYLNASASMTLPSMQYTDDESQFLSDYGASAQNYVESCLAEWLLGKSDIDADWDKYLAQLETLKVQEYIDIMQTAYDRTIGK
ncbi:MAG: extracellular solute-binding protein [Lachnospiraceae bacterium]|nr:extracellular solute-binding protein [Lachnospiraceae bacterium]